MLGVTGLDLDRNDFYKKEIKFQVSCSYGPGRYDPSYESKGLDYPIGYVRWTQKRNFEAILSSLKHKRLNFSTLITEKVDLVDYKKIYSNLSNNSSIATIINYDVRKQQKSDLIKITNQTFQNSEGVIGIIGAGNFTSSIIIPMLKKSNCSIKYIASSKGLSGTTLAKKYKIANSVTSIDKILNDNEVDAVIITTRHDIHAEMVIKSLKAGKHVFVEKPLALKIEEINDIEKILKKKTNSLTVGFNRRFSPFATLAKSLIIHNNPISVVATMNAGFIAADHWTQDLNVGGGRIIGEACHYIDLISFFCGSNVKSVLVNSLGIKQDVKSDNVSISLKYENGSIGVINYFSNGNKTYPKERIEIFQDGKNILIENFRKISFYGYNMRSKKIFQDKGHKAQFNLWNKMGLMVDIQ